LIFLSHDIIKSYPVIFIVHVHLHPHYQLDSTYNSKKICNMKKFLFLHLQGKRICFCETETITIQSIPCTLTLKIEKRKIIIIINYLFSSHPPFLLENLNLSYLLSIILRLLGWILIFWVWVEIEISVYSSDLLLLLLLILILMMKDFHKNHKIYFYSIFTRRYNAKIFELIDRDSEIFNDVDLYEYYYQWKKQNPWGFTHTHALARPQFFHSHF